MLIAKMNGMIPIPDECILDALNRTEEIPDQGTWKHGQEHIRFDGEDEVDRDQGEDDPPNTDVPANYCVVIAINKVAQRGVCDGVFKYTAAPEYNTWEEQGRDQCNPFCIWGEG